MQINIINIHDMPIPSIEAITHWCWLASQECSKSPCWLINIVILNDSEIREANKFYRKIDRPTDILSFNTISSNIGSIGDVPSSLGDLLICPAIMDEKCITWEHIIVHGILHLFGYDHVDNDEAIVMEKLEHSILARIHIRYDAL